MYAGMKKHELSIAKIHKTPMKEYQKQKIDKQMTSMNTVTDSFTLQKNPVALNQLN